MIFLKTGFFRLLGQKWALAALFAGGFSASQAQEFRLESVGVRGGASGNQGASHNFHEVDVFLDADLPWNWDLGHKWWLYSQLDGSAGWLGSSFEDGFIGTLGPGLLLKRQDYPVSVVTGISAAMLSRYDFVEKNFGQLFQFVTYIGFNYDFGQHVRAGYRFQHMSNGGLSAPNPGLNLHMLAVSYLF